MQLLAAAKTAVKSKTTGSVAKKGTEAAATQGDYGAAVLDALRNLNSKSPTQSLTNVKVPGSINPVCIV